MCRTGNVVGVRSPGSDSEVKTVQALPCRPLCDHRRNSSSFHSAFFSHVLTSIRHYNAFTLLCTG